MRLKETMFKLEKIVKRDENFADWYTSIINNAQLIMYGSIKGTVIFQPNGWAIWEAIQNITNKYFSNVGVKNVALPMLIPLDDFAKEKNHLDGFAPECFYVTKVGEKELENPYIIRPTSEILFCKYFKHITQSYKSLPSKLNQWCSVMRAEKTTRPFLRNSEFHWQELHAVFSTQEECVEFTKQILDIYEKIAIDHLCLPVIKGEKTIGERFAGADQTFTIESLMQDGQMLQCGTSHNLGNNFAKIYDIKFQNKNNQYELVHQMSAGISTRLIGGIIMVHSDDNGLVLPPDIAPVQIRVNVLNLKKEPELEKYMTEIKNKLANYRVEFDISDSGLGFKLSNGEIIGTPIQLVLGREAIQNQELILIRRDNLEKTTIKLSDLEKVIKHELSTYKQNIYTKAKNKLDQSIVDVKSIDELKTVLAQNKIARVNWAGDQADELKIKELTGATPRVIIGHQKGVCFYTNKPSNDIVIFGRAY